jgi:hypothetical protein
MQINLSKETTPEFPFYGVIREPGGTVIHCAKPVRRDCEKCIFAKQCAIKASEVIHDK